jgi:hypothetical protein
VTERPNDPAWSAAPPDGAMEPERLAALLDGRLGDAERDALLAQLAVDDEDLALFAEAAAIQRELEEADEVAAVPGVLPLRPAARPARRVDRRWMAAAAVLAGVTLLPLTWRASQGGGAVREPSHAVALLENPSAGLPADFDNRPWSRTRGEGEVVTEEGRPARVGAYMVNLELAIRAGDADNTRLMAQRIAGLLTDANAAGTYAAHSLDPIIARPNAPAAALLPALEQASDGAADVLGADRYALGAWAEAARLAVARRDAAFFQEGRTRTTLESAGALLGDDEQARNAITTVRRASGSDAPDWAGLKKGTNSLLSAIAS